MCDSTELSIVVAKKLNKSHIKCILECGGNKKNHILAHSQIIELLSYVILLSPILKKISVLFLFFCAMKIPVYLRACSRFVLSVSP